MRVIQEGKAYSRIQLSPEEITCIYYALMTQIGHTLTARQRCVSDSAAEVALARQLHVELDLSNEFENIREKFNDTELRL